MSGLNGEDNTAESVDYDRVFCLYYIKLSVCVL